MTGRVVLNMTDFAYRASKTNLKSQLHCYDCSVKGCAEHDMEIGCTERGSNLHHTTEAKSMTPLNYKYNNVY
jgi:hypothetical protein